MNNKLRLLPITFLFAIFSLAVISSVSADPPPPPCLTTNLCFEDAIKATNFTGASDLAIGTINSGSNLDFVTTGWSRDRIRLKTGNGDGAFWGTWTKNMGDGTYEVDIADFNNDGETDIIATNSEQDRVFIRWGLSGWNNATTWATDDNPRYVATADLNNDGLDDFATGNKASGSDSVTVRLRKAGGGFEAPTHYPVLNEFIGDVAFNDCDNDGDLDMFYSAAFADPYDWEAFVYLRLNDGIGGFSGAWGIDMDSLGYGLTLGQIAFGDLDEDGWDDMVVTRSDHKLVRVLGGINCSFNSPIVAGVQNNPYSVEMADMDGDGHLDLVVGHLLQELITIYLGQGNGNLTAPYEPELTLDWHVRDIGVGDFNNDGLMDIVYAEESGAWLLLARDANAPPWQPPWPVINGMGFSPAGQSTVSLVNDRIVLGNIGASGDDGVDVLLDSAQMWSADIEIEGRQGATHTFDVIAHEWGGAAVELVNAQAGMELWPMFNPTSYRIEYLLNDQIQLALTLPSNSQTPAAVINWDEIWCLMNLPPGDPSEICHITYQTGIYGDLDDDGISDIGIWVPQPLTITAADGNLLTADQIRMREIPDGQVGSVRHGFSRVEIRAADVETVTMDEIVRVSAEPPLPAQFGSSIRSWNSQNGPYFTVFDLDTPDTLPNVAPFPAGGSYIGAGEFVNGLSYIIDDADNLYVVDDGGTVQNQYMATAPPGGENYSGMALDPTDGTVYAVSTNYANSTLFTIDVATGNAIVVGPIVGAPGMVAIAIDSNGNLFGIDHITDSYFHIDPTNGNVINSVPLPFNADIEQGLAYDPLTGLLVMLAFNGDTGRGELWTMDVINPAVPVFNFVDALGAFFPGGTNHLTWAGIDLNLAKEHQVHMPVVLNSG